MAIDRGDLNLRPLHHVHQSLFRTLPVHTCPGAYVWCWEYDAVGRSHSLAWIVQLTLQTGFIPQFLPYPIGLITEEDLLWALLSLAPLWEVSAGPSSSSDFLGKSVSRGPFALQDSSVLPC